MQSNTVVHSLLQSKMVASLSVLTIIILKCNPIASQSSSHLNAGQYQIINKTTICHSQNSQRAFHEMKTDTIKSIFDDLYWIWTLYTELWISPEPGQLIWFNLCVISHIQQSDEPPIPNLIPKFLKGKPGLPPIIHEGNRFRLHT